MAEYQGAIHTRNIVHGGNSTSLRHTSYDSKGQIRQAE
jgi:hypothetical protein